MIDMFEVKTKRLTGRFRLLIRKQFVVIEPLWLGGDKPGCQV